MRKNHWFIGLLLCLVLSLTGYKVSAADLQTLSIVLEGDPKAASTLEQALKDNPKVAVSETKTDYSIIVIKPDPTIDYKIVVITPDPSIDYKITIIDPESGKELGNLGRQLGDALREKLRKRPKN